MVLPGSFNGLTAQLVYESGFKGTYVSGAAISGARGLPDIGLLSPQDFCSVITDISRTSGLPILADADTGFGEEEMIRKTVYDYFAAGASGLHLEDQQFPKRCGHLDGKTLISSDAMVSKLQCAVEASKEFTGGKFLICARTDARGVTGIDDALQRAKLYAGAGAQMIFPEGLLSEDEFAMFAKKFSADYPNTYLLANMTEFGKSPRMTASQLGRLGYDAVILPVSTLRTAMGAVKTLLASVREADGKVTDIELNKMQTRQVK